MAPAQEEHANSGEADAAMGPGSPMNDVWRNVNYGNAPRGNQSAEELPPPGVVSKLDLGLPDSTLPPPAESKPAATSNTAAPATRVEPGNSQTTAAMSPDATTSPEKTFSGPLLKNNFQQLEKSINR